ncbi:MAG: hypothetical protein EWV92_07085 [Microcystis aeruginosa Ma_MB_S_20031200_S102]|uniref:Uncharacterized protein n=1 Tax=Microcystis aeruginosa Ma_MB_S_20031200_S102 TaxID=2486254 RepID=A0A552EXN6_MICAE|nr:MAG: hypothetical protein EWV92_07085 [Microcystis aeruginosa Ma_MB_S_20031200_S102]
MGERKFLAKTRAIFGRVRGKQGGESEEKKPFKLYLARNLETILVVGVGKKLMTQSSKSRVIKLFSSDLPIYH